MDNQDPIAAGDELARAEMLALEAEDRELEDAEEALEPEDEELFEIELDGLVYAVPAALKGAFLRQADYTRKTQELAEQRRALEAERKALAERAAMSGDRDRTRLAVLDEHLEEFQGVDWEAYGAEDPQGARALWGRYEELTRAREGLARALADREAREELEAAREAAERMAETGRKLREEIEGWSPQTAAKLVEYGQAFGVTIEELAQMADPRLWKLLHKAYLADQATGAEAQALAQSVRPAVLVTGGAAGAGGVRDELGTREWMRRRNEQAARGR